MAIRRYFTVNTVRALEQELQQGAVGVTGQWVERSGISAAMPAVPMPTSEAGREAVRNFTVDFDAVNHAFSQAVRGA